MIMSKSIYTPRIASETFGTCVMKTDEVFLFIKAATEAGADLETAYDDMRMIDSMLHLKHLHLVIHGEIKRTRAGHLRRGSSLYDALDGVIEARCQHNRARNSFDI